MKITTPFGTSNGVTFTIGDASPTISSISPPSWPAGTSTPITITGTNFGNGTPGISDNSSYVTVTPNGPPQAGGTKIYATATVASSAPAGSVTITVTSMGASGSGFQMPPTGGSGASASYGIQVVQPPLSLQFNRLGLSAVQLLATPSGGTFSFSIASEEGNNVVSGQLVAPASTVPNTLQLSAPSTPPPGSPVPGGRAKVTVTYTTSSGSIQKFFKVPTFGVSCYNTQLEEDWWNGSSCISVFSRDMVPSGTTTDPPNLTGTYCNSFLEMVRLNGSGVARNGTKVKYTGSETWGAVSGVITGADNTPVVANNSLARAASYVPLNTEVDLFGIGTNLRAHDTGSAIVGYRLDFYKGIGSSVCAGWTNPISIGACDPESPKCAKEQL